MIKPDFDRDTLETFRMEGIYDNDPDDPGAETFRGIARAFWPNEEIWPIIDRIKEGLVNKSKRTITFALQNHIELEKMVKVFYRKHFWDPLRLSEMPDAAISEELFDQNVHLPAGVAGRHLQECLNRLNRSYDKNVELYPDLVEDGIIGKKTLEAVWIFINTEPDEHEAIHLLIMLLNGRQMNYYFEGMKKSVIKEKFARGFFSRCYFEKGKYHREEGGL